MKVRPLALLAAALVSAAGLAVPTAAPAHAAPSPAAAAGLQLPFSCGETWRGNDGASKKHKGLEIDFNMGSGSQDLGRKVLAAAAGTVQFAGNKGSGYGNYVQIRHPDGTYTLYAHMGRGLKVRTGQKVAQGQQIGTVAGSSGRSGSIDVHLHFEHKTLPSQGGFLRAVFDGKPYTYGRDRVFLKSNNCGPKKPDPKKPATGPVAHTALAPLDGRTARDPGNHAYKDRYAKGAKVAVVCRSAVGHPTGYPDPTWALTTDHVWVAGQYLAHEGKRGVSPTVRNCAVPTNAKTSVDLNTRSAKDMAAVAEVDRYRKGDTVPVVCTALGGPTSQTGQHTWARTADRRWVPARYLDLPLTKTTGLATGLPRCDTDPSRPEQQQPVKPPVNPAPDRKDGSLRQPSNALIEFLKVEEGLRLDHYNDPTGHCTVGYGRLVHKGKCTAAEERRPNITKATAEKWLREDVRSRVPATQRMTKGMPLSQSEWDALMSMVYNLGAHELQVTGKGRPTEFITMLKAGPSRYKEVPLQMEMFDASDRADIRCSLNKRRQREGRIFQFGDYDSRKINRCNP